MPSAASRTSKIRQRATAPIRDCRRTNLRRTGEWTGAVAMMRLSFHHPTNHPRPGQVVAERAPIRIEESDEKSKWDQRGKRALERREEAGPLVGGGGDDAQMHRPFSGRGAANPDETSPPDKRTGEFHQ